MQIRLTNIFKNTVFFYISQLFNKILYLVLIIFISKYLGVISLGRYASTFALIGIISVFVNTGIDSLLVKEVATHKEDANKYFSNALLLKLCLGFTVFLASILVSMKIVAFQDIKNLVIMLAIASFFSSFTCVFYAVLIAYEKVKRLMILTVLRDIIGIGLAIFIILSGGKMVHVFSCFIISSVTGFLLAITVTRRLGIQFQKQINLAGIWLLFKKSILFTLSAIFLFMIFRIDFLILKLIQGNYAVGLYRAASSFLMNLEMFPLFFILTLYPKYSRLFKKNRSLLVKLFKKASVYLLCLNIVILSFIFISGRYLILLFFGPEFTESIVILRYAIFPVFFLFQNIINVYVFNAMNKPLYNVFIFGAGILINILLDLFYIPKYSYYGVLLAIFFSYLFIYISSSCLVAYKLKQLQTEGFV